MVCVVVCGVCEGVWFVSVYIYIHIYIYIYMGVGVVCTIVNLCVGCVYVC